MTDIIDQKASSPAPRYGVSPLSRCLQEGFSSQVLGQRAAQPSRFTKMDLRSTRLDKVDFKAKLVKYREAKSDYAAAIQELRYRCEDVVTEAIRALAQYCEDDTRNSVMTLHVRALSCAERLRLGYCVGQSDIALGPNLTELITELANPPSILSQNRYDSVVEILSQEYTDEYCIEVIYWLLSRLLGLHTICYNREELVE